MSIKALEWALKRAPAPDPLSHLVLIGLADHAGDDGAGAWPSVGKLAEYSRCSPRTVQRKLDVLESAGIIVRGDQRTVAHLRADRRPTVWDLRLDGVTESHPVDATRGDTPDAHGVTGEATRGDTPDAHGVTLLSDRTVHRTVPEPSIEPSTRAHARGALDAAWETFWDLYPRHVGKQDARKAFDRAARTVDPETIVAGAARLAEDPNLPDKQFIPHPGTWLRQGRWDDEPLPPRHGGSRADEVFRRELARINAQDPRLLHDVPQIGAS